MNLFNLFCNCCHLFVVVFHITATFSFEVTWSTHCAVALVLSRTILIKTIKTERTELAFTSILFTRCAFFAFRIISLFCGLLGDKLYDFTFRAWLYNSHTELTVRHDKVPGPSVWFPLLSYNDEISFALSGIRHQKCKHHII